MSPRDASDRSIFPSRFVIKVHGFQNFVLIRLDLLAIELVQCAQLGGVSTFSPLVFQNA